MSVKIHRVMCFIVTALLILLQITGENRVEKQFKCKDEQCSEPIGEFQVLLNYVPDTAEKISAQKKDHGYILAKPLDDDIKLLKVKINDKIGFLPADKIREFRTFEANTNVTLSISLRTTSKASKKETTLETKLEPDGNTDVRKDEIIEEKIEASINESFADTSILTPSPPSEGVNVETKLKATEIVEELQNSNESSIDVALNNTENLIQQISANKEEAKSPPTIENDTPRSEISNISVSTAVTSESANEPSTKIVEELQNSNESSSDVALNNTENSIQQISTNKEDAKSPPTVGNGTPSSEISNISGSVPVTSESANEPSTKNDKSETHSGDIENPQIFENNIINQEISNVSEANVNINESTINSSAKIDDMKGTEIKSPLVQNDFSQSIPSKPETPNDSGKDTTKPVPSLPENIDVTSKPNVKSNIKVSEPEVQNAELNINFNESLVKQDKLESSTQENITEKGNLIGQSESILEISSDIKNDTHSTKQDNVTGKSQSIPEILSDIKNDTHFDENLNASQSNINTNDSIPEFPSTTENLNEVKTEILSDRNNTSQNIPAEIESPKDSLEDIKSTNSNINTESTTSPGSVTGGETIPPSKPKIPMIPYTMRTSPDNKDQPVTPNINVQSQKDDSIAKFTTDPYLKMNNQAETSPSDPATPKEILPDIHAPNTIETATQPIDTTIPTENINSQESPVEPPSPISDKISSVETHVYDNLKSFAAHSEIPIVNEPITSESDLSAQEITETAKTIPESVNQADESKQSETPSISLDVDQRQRLSDFIHSPRKKIVENEVGTVIAEDSQEKSIYETVSEYFPDFSVLLVDMSSDWYEKLRGLFDFGSSREKSEYLESESCSADQFCGTDRLNSYLDKPTNSEIENIVEIPLLGVVNREQITLISGIITASIFATIIFWWLMNFFNKRSKINALVSKINKLENKLLIANKEIDNLQNQIVENDSTSKQKQNAADTKRITEVYEHKINQYKKRIVELDDKVIYLEKELENVSNSALEMHKLLENSLATQAQSKVALDEVETLRSLTETQEIQIEDLKKEINSVVTENQCLKVDNEMNKSTIKKLEKECNAQTKKNVELSEKNCNLTLQLDKELENNNVMESNYKSEIYELRSKLEDVEMTLKRSEFQVQELQRALLDYQDGAITSNNDVQLKIQISTLEALNNELGGRLNEQKNARRMVEDHMGDIVKELNNLKKSYENSEKEKNQANTKLQVLTQYFKDKEEQLHKELEAKDKLNVERESKDQSLSQKLSIMRDEISNLKIQNEELKKEVLDQEASYKVQLANAEQKTREHWFALRQAERKYKESQQEAASLRNRVLVLETNMSSISQKGDDKNNSGLNGDISAIPPVLYHPSLSPELLPFPPQSEFIPPPPSPIPSHFPDFFPPEPIYSPDERLPPLGGRRAPTPPLPIIPPDDDFTPPPPVMKYPAGIPMPSGYSRRTPPPNARHRPQYKSRQPRNSLDSPSPSSGLSLESLDKSGR